MCKLSKIWVHQKIIISNRDASNTQETIWQTNGTEKKDLVMYDVSSAVEIILWIKRDVWSTMTYKRKHTHLSIWKYTLLPHKSSKPYTFNE
jgi:hypothetical protein